MLPFQRYSTNQNWKGKQISKCIYKEKKQCFQCKSHLKSRCFVKKFFNMYCTTRVFMTSNSTKNESCNPRNSTHSWQMATSEEWTTGLWRTCICSIKLRAATQIHKVFIKARFFSGRTEQLLAKNKSNSVGQLHLSFLLTLNYLQQRNPNQ